MTGSCGFGMPNKGAMPLENTVRLSRLSNPKLTAVKLDYTKVEVIEIHLLITCLGLACHMHFTYGGCSWLCKIVLQMTIKDSDTRKE